MDQTEAVKAIIEEVKRTQANIDHAACNAEIERLMSGQRILLNRYNRANGYAAELEAQVEQLTRTNNQAIERMRIAEFREGEEQQRRETAESYTARLRTALLDAEGSLLAYWTDIPQTEIERLTVAIRSALGSDKAN